jgi:hypothetical protein
MKITFTKWNIDSSRRKPVAVEPTRVDVIEHYQDAHGDDGDKATKIRIAIWWGEDGHDHVPAATRIIMQNKQEFLVQGTVEEVTKAINQK